MATLRRHPHSPYWHACLTLQDGTRTNRSTGTGDRREAERVANKFEDAISDAKRGRFTDARARKTIADIYALGSGEDLASSTTADFFDAWLKRKELEASPNTHEKYTGILERFTKFLGTKKSRDVSAVSAADVAKFRDQLAGELAIGTVNVALKILRTALGQARRDGLVDVNVAERVTTLKRRADLFERRAFTLDELRQVLAKADAEWRGMILFGLYTGQRLGDISALTWQNIDLQREEVQLVTEKTGRQQIIPLVAPLVRYLEALPSSDKPDAPLFPNAHAIVERLGRASQLSNQFYDLLSKAGLARKKSHHAVAGSEKGRSARRDLNPLSFHSLRHTATTLMKSAGISDSITMELVGHDSANISRKYTHIPTQVLRKAVSKLPDVTR